MTDLKWIFLLWVGGLCLLVGMALLIWYLLNRIHDLTNQMIVRGRETVALLQKVQVHMEQTAIRNSSEWPEAKAFRDIQTDLLREVRRKQDEMAQDIAILVRRR